MFIRKIVPVLCIATACFAQNAPTSKPGLSTSQISAEEAKTRIKEITPEQFKALVATSKKFTLIDVREDNEWAAGHAADALHIVRGVLDRDIKTKVPRKTAKIILYCRGGSRSALAADTLQKMGYSNVFSLAGGFLAYQKLGLPVEK